MYRIVFINNNTEVRAVDNLVPFKEREQADALAADLNAAMIRQGIFKGFYAVASGNVQNKIGS